MQVLQVFAIPLVKRLQKLQPLAGGAHVYPLPAAVLGRVLVGVLPRVEVLQQGTGTCGYPVAEGKLPMPSLSLPVNIAASLSLTVPPPLAQDRCYRDTQVLGRKRVGHRACGSGLRPPRPRPVCSGSQQRVAVPTHRSGKLIGIWGLQLELLAILACQEVGLWVELEGASNGQGCDNLKQRGSVCWLVPNTTPVSPL